MKRSAPSWFVSKRSARVLLADMIEAIEQAARFAEGYDRAAFIADDKTVQSVCRCFEILGEAAVRTPQALRDGVPDIPWPRLIALRNRLIHAYFDVDREQLWKILSDDAPPLLPVLRAALERAEGEEGGDG
jgi:uncharacterized protein with HEPN domain